jgi:hypothetical protein
MPQTWRFTPDCSENPFCFFFKNKKSVAESGYMAGKVPKRVGTDKKQGDVPDVKLQVVI